MSIRNTKAVTALLVLVVAFAYAIIRYNVIKGVPWEELPLFISNKAISLSAVILIGLSYALGSLARFWPQTFSSTLGLRKFFGLFGFGLAAFHGFVSLLLFTPSHYPKFFLESGRLSTTGEFSMLFGVLAFFVFAIVAVTSIPSVADGIGNEKWHRVQRLGYLGLVLVFFHVFAMGIEGWLKPEGWPGGLLPISLVAASIIAFVLLVKIAALVFARGSGARA